MRVQQIVGDLKRQTDPLAVHRQAIATVAIAAGQQRAQT